jgi:hypothetical protein
MRARNCLFVIVAWRAGGIAGNRRRRSVVEGLKILMVECEEPNRRARQLSALSDIAQPFKAAVSVIDVHRQDRGHQ